MTTIGQRKRFSADFESNDIDTDPSTVTVKVMDPDGEQTTPAAEHDGAGQYHVDVDLTKFGPWIVRFEGTGTVPAAVEHQISVERSAFYV